MSCSTYIEELDPEMADAFVSRKFQFSDSLNDFPIPEYANYGNYHG